MELFFAPLKRAAGQPLLAGTQLAHLGPPVACIVPSQGPFNARAAAAAAATSLVREMRDWPPARSHLAPPRLELASLALLWAWQNQFARAPKLCK